MWAEVPLDSRFPFKAEQRELVIPNHSRCTHQAKSIWVWFNNMLLTAIGAQGITHSLHVSSLPIPALCWNKLLVHLHCRRPREPIHPEIILSKSLSLFSPLNPDYFYFPSLVHKQKSSPARTAMHRRERQK